MSKLGGYYRSTGKSFAAKKDGYCRKCKKPIKKGEPIVVVFFTECRFPMHEKCE